VVDLGTSDAGIHYIKKQREINADGDNKDEAHDS